MFKGLIIVLVALMISSFTSNNDIEKKWYKGNTHTHTTASDGNESAKYVVNWYHKRGYNFLVLTDHNKFIDPDTVSMPVNQRDDFILIPGEEATGKIAIHSTALNIKGYVHPGHKFNSKTEVIQSHVDSIRAAGGVPVFNHPNFSSGAQVDDILPVKHLHMLELYNGHHGVNNFGIDNEKLSHIPVEAKWDSLLTHGMRYYGVAADDAHHYVEFYNKRANPGRGWVMVKSSELSADSIVAAMQRGDFYSSNGVMLKTVGFKNNTYKVEIDMDATKKELKSATLLGHFTETEKPGYRIEFIGSGGEVLQSTEGKSASYKIQDEKGYVRARAIYCRKRTKDQFEKIFAWTQPVFLK